MKQENLLDISVLQIELFILLAEKRNFSRVAELTNMTQPTLSKRIFQLENTLNMQLFERKSRPVELTPEGQALYKSWKTLMDVFNSSIREANEVSGKSDISLNIGAPDSGNDVVSMPALANSIHEEMPELRLGFSYYSLADWRQAMLDGEVDIMINTLFETETLDDIFQWEELAKFNKDICMLKTNPLAQKERITYEDLKNQRFVMISPLAAPGYSRFVRSICRDHGFEPDVARYVAHANNLISGLHADNEVLVCDRLLRDVNNPLLSLYPLPDTHSAIVAIWRKDNNNPLIPGILAAAKEHYARATKLNTYYYSKME